MTATLDARPASRRQRRSAHTPGEVLRDVAVLLADGGTCLSDLVVLAGQAELFGQAASVPTAWRTIDAVASDEHGAEALRVARAAAMGWAWDRRGGPPLVDGMLTIDIDATHVIAHSEQKGTGGTLLLGVPD